MLNWIGPGRPLDTDKCFHRAAPIHLDYRLANAATDREATLRKSAWRVKFFVRSRLFCPSILGRSADDRNDFAPAVSNQAGKVMRQRIRRWKLHLRNDLGLGEIARWTRPVLVGWLRYYGHFYPSALHRALRTLDRFLVRWVRRKYKRFRDHAMRARDWLNRLRARQPTLFAHWGLRSTVGR